MLAKHGGRAVGIVKVETSRVVPRLANKIRRSIAVIFLVLRTSGRKSKHGLGYSYHHGYYRDGLAK
jgi:hypothetical protein